MECKAKPYEGNEPYIFFSYCREDAEIVYPIIEQMAEEGFRVWYDNGIHVGDDWPQQIAIHLKDSFVCIAAITEKADNSHNCRRELQLSLNYNKKLVPIFLEEFSMTPALEYLVCIVQYIKKYELQNDVMFYKKLYNIEQMETCRGTISLLKKEKKSEKKEIITEKQEQKEVIKEPENEEEKQIETNEPKEEQLEKIKEDNTKAENLVKTKEQTEDLEKPTKTKENKEETNKLIQINIGEEKKTQREEDETEGTIIVDDPKEKTKKDSKPNSTLDKINKIAIFGCFSKEKMFLLNKKNKIGRSQKKCDIVLDNPAVSSLHAVIFYESGKFYIRDSDSTNGTTLNFTEKIEALEPVELDTYTLLSLSSTEMCLFAQDKFAEWIIEHKKCAVLECEETEELMVIDSEDALLFGRFNIWPKGTLSDKHISREVGYIFLEDDKCFLEMTHKKEVSKTFLNERLLKPSETVELTDGDELVMGMGEIYHIKFYWLQLELGE